MARAVRAAVPRPREHARSHQVVAGDEERWVARPLLARCIQLVVLAVPVAAAVACAAIVSGLLPHAHDIGAALLWWAVVVASSTVTMWAVDRVARRLLPLALLLRLSLVFPDRAPDRFHVAVRSWNTRHLREQVAGARGGKQSGLPVEAAARVIALLASLAMHDRRTRGHCERVRAYNDLLAEELGLPQHDRDRLRWAALIHDIGKLQVPNRLLNKAGKPSSSEWSVLRAHPLRGAEIAAPLAPWLGPWAAAIEEHHERWDGAGYPHGLAGSDISLGARIVAVADAFEVMTSPRPYSRAVDPARARKELAACAGTHFDPTVVRAFLNISLGRLRKAMGPIAWFTQVPFLAGMPRLEAAILKGGQQAASGMGAGAAAGVVAVTAVGPGAAQAVAHPAYHHHHHSVVAAPIALHHHASASTSAATSAHHQVATPAVTGRRAGSQRGRDSAQRTTPPATLKSTGTALQPHQADATGQVLPSGDPVPAVTETPTEPPTETPAAAAHGRCTGNSGNGLGNGGAGPGAEHHGRHDNSQDHAKGRATAPGLHACD